MTRFSFRPREFPTQINNGRILPVDDLLEAEHWQIVVNHPAFLADLGLIKEEIDEVYPGVDVLDLEVAALDDPLIDWPSVRSASDQWGIPPAAIIAFADLSLSEIERIRPEAIDLFRQEANGLVVYETDSEFVIRIPRPLTKSKESSLTDWLKSLPTDGPREKAWNRVDKKREDLSPTLIESIDWFQRWNCPNCEEPTDIWRDLTKPGGTWKPRMLHDYNVYDRIVAVWERMRQLSPDQIRSDRPSKKATHP